MNSFKSSRIEALPWGEEQNVCDERFHDLDFEMCKFRKQRLTADDYSGGAKWSLFYREFLDFDRRWKIIGHENMTGFEIDAFVHNSVSELRKKSIEFLKITQCIA